jgi:ARG and Rhodanese-Phosphatase-superfamily-associated Protein domain
MPDIHEGWQNHGGLTALATLAVFGMSFMALGLTNGTARVEAGDQNWRVVEPVTYENLIIFPIVSSQSADTSAFLTLDEALAAGDAVVTEQGSDILRRTRDGRLPGGTAPWQGDGAQVNQLVLINRGKKPLVLLAGEVISGGKQDRVIGKDRIVPVGAEPLPLDVFCVEHGRWNVAATKFAAAKMMAHPSVRERAAVDQDQSGVWAAVRNGTTAAMASARPNAVAPALSPNALADLARDAAPTGSYVKLYGSRQVAGSVENFANEMEKRFARAKSNLKGEHVVGVVVAYGGEVAWSDVFASPQLFEGYWPKLLRSYVVEALARPELKEHASVEDAREFLARNGGHEKVESEPGVYRWLERTEGHFAEIELAALAPKMMTLHWLKVLRTN